MGPVDLLDPEKGNVMKFINQMISIHRHILYENNYQKLLI